MGRTKPGSGKPRKRPKRVTRYDYEELTEPRTPETGHTALLRDEHVVTLPMDGRRWSGALDLARLPENGDDLVVVDMDAAVDPVLLWSGKRNQRDVPVLPLQRSEVVAESRIGRIIDRARESASREGGDGQGSL